MVRYGLLVCSLLVVGVTYRVHVVINRPLPPGIQDETKVRILDEIGRIANHMLDACLYSGVPMGTPAAFMVDSVFRFLVGSMTSHNDDVKVFDQTIQDIPVRVFHPQGRARNTTYPTLVYVHGGGWAWLTVDSYTAFLSELANSTGILIIAPEYRKPPLHNFPIPYTDCETVMLSIIKGNSGLPVDKRHVIVGGDGSGGNIAAALAQTFRQKIFMQVLINPALQVMDFQTPSYRDNRDVIEGITSAKRQIRKWLMYIRIPTHYTSSLDKNAHVSLELRHSKYANYVNSTLYLPPYLNITKKSTLLSKTYRLDAINRFKDILTNNTLAPMMLSNLNGVASAYVITSQYDVLRDEGIMYASRLFESEVKVKLKHYTSSFHGFLLLSTPGPLQMEASVHALQELSDFLRFQLRGFTG